MMEAVFYIARNQQRTGPFSIAQLQALALSGRVQPTDMLLPEGKTQWIAAGSLQELFPVVTANAIPSAVLIPSSQVEPHKPSAASEGRHNGCFTALWAVNLVIGFIITLRYWSMDTYILTNQFERIHNVGLMNDRLVGVVVGGGWINASMLALICARSSGRK